MSMNQPRGHLVSLKSEAAAKLLPMSFVIPAKHSQDILHATVTKIHEFSERIFGQRFEILIVVNPIPNDATIPLELSESKTLKAAENLARDYVNVRVIKHFKPFGKYAALKAGVQASRGEWIFITDADLPFSLEFFEQARKQLLEGADLVVGNRRKLESITRVPAHLLPRFLWRDLLSRIFNAVVLALFPNIHLRDTQAGIKAMSRTFAMQAFERQICPGFFGDIELLLCALRSGKRLVDLPIEMDVNDNKSSVRVARELVSVVIWLSRIFVRNLRDDYRISKTP